MLLSKGQYLICICAIILLSSCTASNVKHNFNFDNKDSTGLIIGSITQDIKPGSNSANTFFYIYPENEGMTYEMLRLRENKYSLITGFYKQSEFSDLNGRIFAIELPVGKHNLKSWQVDNGTGAYLSPKKTPPPLYFTVKPGEILYLGNIHMHLLTGENIFGINITGGAMPVIKNEYNRDIILFRKRYAKLRNHNITLGVLNIGPWHSEDSIENSKTITVQPPVFIK